MNLEALVAPAMYDAAVRFRNAVIGDEPEHFVRMTISARIHSPYDFHIRRQDRNDIVHNELEPPAPAARNQKGAPVIAVVKPKASPHEVRYPNRRAEHSKAHRTTHYDQYHRNDDEEAKDLTDPAGKSVFRR